MIVYIEESVFEQYDSYPLEILNIFKLGRDGRHYILTDPVFDEDNQNSPINIWLNQLDPYSRDACFFTLIAGIEVVKEPTLDLTIHTINGNISEWDKNPPRLTLEDTCKILNQPLRIILENSRNDLAFLECIIRPCREKIES